MKSQRGGISSRYGTSWGRIRKKNKVGEEHQRHQDELNFGRQGDKEQGIKRKKNVCDLQCSTVGSCWVPVGGKFSSFSSLSF